MKWKVIRYYDIMIILWRLQVLLIQLPLLALTILKVLKHHNEKKQDIKEVKEVVSSWAKHICSVEILVNFHWKLNLCARRKNFHLYLVWVTMNDEYDLSERDFLFAFLLILLLKRRFKSIDKD